MEYSSHPMMTNNSGPRDYNACDSFASTEIALAMKRMLCFPFRTTDGRFNNSSHTIPMSYMVREIRTFKSLIEAKEAKTKFTALHLPHARFPDLCINLPQTRGKTYHITEPLPRNCCHELFVSPVKLFTKTSLAEFP